MSAHLSFAEIPDISALSPNPPAPNTCGPFTCYGPNDLRKVYNFPTTLDGTGQTIIIVEAYGSASITTDLAKFDELFGVPAPATRSFKVINVPGTGVTGSGALLNWRMETSLDVEYAHAMAPGAKIVLAVAATDNNFDMNAAEAQVLHQYPGAIVSQSFGDFETDPSAGSSFAEQHRILEAATQAGDTLLASTGDAGATFTPHTGAKGPAVASYPASDPLVTSVGGTEGSPYPGGLDVNGSYGGETTWNEPLFGQATGGAPSILFKSPAWQRPVTRYKTRTVPDVAYNAAFNGGLKVVMQPGFFLAGGTSCGTPQWAAIFALINQARAKAGQDAIGFANKVLYKVAERKTESSPAFHDITSGNNALDSTIGFAAGPGYDLATGWGTPNVTNLVGALVDVGVERNPQSDDPGHAEGPPAKSANPQSDDPGRAEGPPAKSANHSAGTMDAGL